MKTQEKSKHKTLKGVFGLSLMFALVCSVGCKNDDTSDKVNVTPPDPSKTTEIKSFFPDSGGVATKVILTGSNFGTDTAYVKVKINGKNLKVIGVKDTIIYAIMPSRADTGNINVLVGKGADVVTFVYPTKFKYRFSRNVTTVFGQLKAEGTDDGTYAKVKLRRPWFLLFDRDGTMYFLEEGRGNNSDGGLRKATNGSVTTLLRNSSGVMQSPTSLAFNLANDTLLLVQNLWNANNMVSDATVAALPRDAGFITIKGLIRSIYSQASGIAVHPITGDIYFNSKTDGFLYKYDRLKKIRTTMFTFPNATGTDVRLAFTPDGTILYMVLCDRHCIYKATYNNTLATVENPQSFVGLNGSWGNAVGIGSNARFDTPGQIAVDADNGVYIPDYKNHCIRYATASGNVSTFAGIASTTAGFLDGDPSVCKFNNPQCVAINPVDKGLYVADRGNALIRKIMVE